MTIRCYADMTCPDDGYWLFTQAPLGAHCAGCSAKARWTLHMPPGIPYRPVASYCAACTNDFLLLKALEG